MAESACTVAAAVNYGRGEHGGLIYTETPINGNNRTSGGGGGLAVVIGV